MRPKLMFVYILASRRNGTLYTGVTRNLRLRYLQHQCGLSSAFTSRYQVNNLVYYEIFNSPIFAIAREKQIKAGSRADKIRLIESKNPKWTDLYDNAQSIRHCEKRSDEAIQ